MELNTIDINCDLGESYGRFRIGNDVEMMNYITSCNIACGFHGGDPLTIQEAISHALRKGIAIGAHVSYPDLLGFGRRSMAINQKELYSLICYQLSAISGMVSMQSGKLHHLKLHGALYNDANRSEEISNIVVDVMKDWGEQLWLYCPENTVLARIAGKYGVRVCREAFVDRKYQDPGVLAARSEIGAVIREKDQSIKQLLSILQSGAVKTIEGKTVPLQADTICLHGDHPDSVDLAKKVNETLSNQEILMKYIPYL